MRSPRERMRVVSTWTVVVIRGRSVDIDSPDQWLRVFDEWSEDFETEITARKAKDTRVESAWFVGLLATSTLSEFCGSRTAASARRGSPLNAASDRLFRARLAASRLRPTSEFRTEHAVDKVFFRAAS